MIATTKYVEHRGEIYRLYSYKFGFDHFEFTGYVFFERFFF